MVVLLSFGLVSSGCSQPGLNGEDYDRGDNSDFGVLERAMLERPIFTDQRLCLRDLSLLNRDDAHIMQSASRGFDMQNGPSYEKLGYFMARQLEP